MGFEARGDTIKGLLSSSRQYKIPRFQREFSWEESNYKEFYIDILKQIKRNDSIFQTGQYYFGNMLFLGNKEDSEVDVIDGQQRLTTTTIFLGALRDTLFCMNQTNAKEYAETIQNEYIAKILDGKAIIKLRTESSYPYFSQKIQDFGKEKKLMEKPKSEEEEGIEKTYDFFRKSFRFDRLMTVVKQCSSIILKEEEHTEFLKALRDQLINSEIIAVFINDKNQANQIFENINSKGKPLSPIDLIKNSIFSMVPVSRMTGVDDLSLKWKQLAKKIADSKQIAGFNEFFLHYWKAKYPKDSANGVNLYKKYITRFGDSNGDEIIDLVCDLEKNLDTYLNISEVYPDNFRRQEEKQEFEYLTALKYFNAVQVRVPLLTLYKTNVKISSEKKNEILKFLAYFHFIAFGTSIKFRSNQITGVFKKFTIDINCSKNKTEISNAFDDLKFYLVNLLKKDEIRAAFESLKYAKSKATKTYSEFPTSFIMKEIAKKYDNMDFCDAQYSIEHIIDEEESPQNRNIGNILILEKSINDDLAKEKNIKRKEHIDKTDFYKRSKYGMVGEFISKYPAFKSENIDGRTDELFNYFWDNLWLQFIETPRILRGVWVEKSEDKKIIINTHDINFGGENYSLTGYKKENNMYIIYWDIDKKDYVENPQPFIIECLSDNEIHLGLTYYREK